jgi:hypothetical protein
MAKIINPLWKNKMTSAMDCAQPIDVVTQYNINIQWLIVELARRGTPFRLYNLGAGVKRVTTDTQTCPCCKRAIE